MLTPSSQSLMPRCCEFSWAPCRGLTWLALGLSSLGWFCEWVLPGLTRSPSSSCSVIIVPACVDWDQEGNCSVFPGALSWLLPTGDYYTMLCLGYCLLEITIPCFVLATAYWKLLYHALSWLLPSGDFSTMLCLGYCLLEITIACFVLATAFWRF